MALPFATTGAERVRLRGQPRARYEVSTFLKATAGEKMSTDGHLAPAWVSESTLSIFPDTDPRCTAQGKTVSYGTGLLKFRTVGNAILSPSFWNTDSFSAYCNLNIFPFCTVDVASALRG